MAKKCCPKSKNNIRLTPRGGFFLTLAIAILPKCPFCLMAYSGAITLCSGKKIVSDPTITSYISLGLALLVLISIVFNYRRHKTPMALFLATVGISLLFLSEWILGDERIYYLGGSFLLFGVWFNGSFLYIYKNILLKNLNNLWRSTTADHLLNK